MMSAETFSQDRSLIAEFPPMVPTAKLVWTAVVDVAERIDRGATKEGHRFEVPIVGGRFYGGEEFAALSGMVLPGGADKQRLRPDGVKELDACYDMRADCGAIIAIRNRVVVDDQRKPDRYAMSVVQATAPEGQFDWLNRRLLIGTLQSARPARPTVIVRAWLADTL